MSDVIDHSDISVAGEVNYLVSSRDSLGYPISQILGKIGYFASTDEFTKSMHPAINEKNLSAFRTSLMQGYHQPTRQGAHWSAGGNA